MMNKRFTFLPVALALLLFILAQFFIVRQVWRQKDEVFKVKYRAGSQEAIDNLMVKVGDTGFNYAFWMVDYVSKSHLERSKVLVDKEDSLKFRTSVRENVTKMLSDNEVLSGYLTKHFDKLGLEKDFKFKIFVNELYLIDFNKKFLVYKSPVSEMKKQNSKGLVLVNTFFSEGDSYKITFDYYIDITEKKKIILKELGITLFLSIGSLLVMAAIFIATLRNYLEEKRLSNLKTDFINNMTHELKTPLSTITVAGKTLKLEGILDSKEKILDTANLIGKQSIHLNKLINLILEISMWERSQFQVEMKESDVEELLSDIVDGFRNGCGQECSFESQFDLKGAKANIDNIYFITMINNLLNNAVKYSGENKEIKLKAVATDNIKISIIDNGVGISRSDQKHIFEKFYRVTTGNIHKTKGLGLGLYYVKRIAQAHEGDVSVSSKPGKGSVFSITLPKK